MKVLFDTCVLISKVGRPKDLEDKQNTATKVIDKCDELGYIKCISLRTVREFEKGWDTKSYGEKQKKEKALLNEFVKLPYYHGNETWDQIEAPWENIYSGYENEQDFNLSKSIEEDLPGVKNKRDRGIFLDALKYGCKIVISEDWTDFEKLKELGAEHGVVVTKPGLFLLNE